MRPLSPMTLGTAFGPITIILLLTLMSASVAGKFYNFCEDVSHGSFFEYGCCNGTQLDYGVDFQANWKSCVDDSKPSSLIQESMWTMYLCIVKNSLGKKTLTLSHYAQVMAKEFQPAELRRMVRKLAQERDLPDDEEYKTPLDLLKRVRIAYHKIEKEVCTGQSFESEDWTKCDDGLDTLRENQHLRGDCCLSSQIPIRITYLRRQPSEVAQECTLEIAKEAGMIKKYSGFLEIGRQTTFLGKSHEQSDVRSMCLQTCVFKSDFGITQAYSSTEPFQFGRLVGRFINFLPQSTQDMIIQKIDEVEMNKQVDDSVDGILDNILGGEFTVYADRHQARMVLRVCEANNVAVRHIEGVLTQLCTVD